MMASSKKNLQSIFVPERLEVVIAKDPNGPTTFCMIQDVQTYDLFVPLKYAKDVLQTNNYRKIQSFKNRLVFPDNPKCILRWPSSLEIPPLTKKQLYDCGFPGAFYKTGHLRCVHIGIVYSALKTADPCGEYALTRTVCAMNVQRTDPTYMIDDGVEEGGRVEEGGGGEERTVEEERSNQNLQDQVHRLETTVHAIQEWMNLATVSLAQLTAKVYHFN
jgi:hypothetical protein